MKLRTLATLATLTLASTGYAADLPQFSQIPTGHVTMPKTRVPGYVGGNEAVKGLYVVNLGGFGVTGATVTASDKIRASLRAGSGEDVDEQAPCISELPPGSFSFEREEEPDWNGSFMPTTQVYAKGPQVPQGGVTLVHVERLNPDGASPSLESTDAWVDPATRGARLAEKSTLPLKLMDASVGGVRVYAGRDEKGDKRLVQFVVASRVSRSVRGIIAVLDGLRSSHATCGHLRVALPITPAGKSAQIIVPVELPPLDPSAKPNPIEAAAVLPGGRRFVEREARIRELRVQVSVSQTSRDREPLVGVSFGWAGREHLDRVVTQEPAEEKTH